MCLLFNCWSVFVSLISDQARDPTSVWENFLLPYGRKPNTFAYCKLNVLFIVLLFTAYLLKKWFHSSGNTLNKCIRYIQVSSPVCVVSGVQETQLSICLNDSPHFLF